MNIFYDLHNRKHTLPKGRIVEWRISGYAIVLNENKEVLMNRMVNQTTWDLPGGGIDVNEKLHEGIQRECMEETGYSVVVTDKMPFLMNESNFYADWEDRYTHSVQLFYTGKLVYGVQNKNAIHTEETEEVTWKSLSSLNEINVRKVFWPCIQLLQSHKL